MFSSQLSIAMTVGSGGGSQRLPQTPMREGKGECCADMAFSNPPILQCLRPRLGGVVAGKGSPPRPGAESTLAVVVLVSKDVLALPVLPVLNTALLACTHVSIGTCSRFCLGNARLSVFNLRDF